MSIRCPTMYTMRWVILRVFSQQYWVVTGLTQHQHAAIRRRISITLTIRSLEGSLSGLAIAFTIRSVDRSYKRIWRYTGTASMTEDPSSYRCDRNLTDRGTGFYRHRESIP